MTGSTRFHVNRRTKPLLSNTNGQKVMKMTPLKLNFYRGFFLPSHPDPLRLTHYAARFKTRDGGPSQKIIKCLSGLILGTFFCFLVLGPLTSCPQGHLFLFNRKARVRVISHMTTNKNCAVGPNCQRVDTKHTFCDPFTPTPQTRPYLRS